MKSQYIDQEISNSNEEIIKDSKREENIKAYDYSNDVLDVEYV